ncbi:MAG: hypothetical protein LQ350_007390 [Teloschistes chrysophthalmus]|nr:MAG: hypothetical protein LQ350_007390 [Niorma chrysophthalma]
MASLVRILSFFLLTSIAVALYPTKLVYQFPNGTWLEALAVRPAGTILTTLLTSPDLYLIHPDTKSPSPKLIHHFSSHTALLGITETTPDTFFVIATNYSEETRSAVPGSSAIYRVHFPNPHTTDPIVSHAANLPRDTIIPNGLTALNAHTLLVADSRKGTVISVNTLTGLAQTAIEDPLLLPPHPFDIGVNGLKILPDPFHPSSPRPPSPPKPGQPPQPPQRQETRLIFTNTFQNLLVSLPIDPLTARSRGPATIIARGLTYPVTAGYDDFCISPDGKQAFLVTGGGNSIVSVDMATGTLKVVAGDVNSTSLAEPTAVVLGRGGGGGGGGKMYVSTAGGAALPVWGHRAFGGQVVEVELGM